ncbi:MAG: ABC transporter permease [Acidobacteriota bacterium]|nr:ABC transporter permease [Acidobacteriota bacterium]
MQTLLQDLRYGARMLMKQPGFTLIAVLTLALGIGANTALFSIVNGVLLNPLPFPQPEQLIALNQSKPNFPRGAIPYPNFRDWQRENQTFAALAISRRTSFSLLGAGEPEQVDGRWVSATFFSVLGVRPAMGRDFAPGEDERGSGPVVLISDALWQRKFGASTGVLSQSLTLDDKSYTIVGVLPASFTFYRGLDVYLPIGQWNTPALQNRSAALGLSALGRLKPGVTLAQAQADMDGVMRRLAETYPENNRGHGASLTPLKEAVVGNVRQTLWLLLGAVGFVLLIACVNVSNLLLTRSTGRTREFAIRAALGAGQGRLLRQMLTESLLLALVGGGLGLLLASWLTSAALSVLPTALPRAAEIELDGRVLLFTGVISLLTGLLAGLAPAWKMARRQLTDMLKEGGRGAAHAQARAQGALVVVEMALALVLLIGAGLTIRSLYALWNVDPGFRAENVLTFSLNFPPAMRQAKPEAALANWRALSEQLNAVPGVQAASFMQGATILQSANDVYFWRADQPRPATTSEMQMTLVYRVEPGYLTALGIPLKRGRFFTPQDDNRAKPVVVIDEVFARQHFPNTDPIGKQINQGDDRGALEIVGVVGHVRQWGLATDDQQTLRAQLYEPLHQTVANPTRLDVVVRGEAGAGTALFDALRRTIQSQHSQNVVFGLRTMNEVVSDSLAAQRFSMLLLNGFAIVALLLASIGLYGVIAYLVSQRTHEIGIRLALGASRLDVLRLVFQHGLKLALGGVALGLLAALGLTRLLATLLYGVSATDPLTFAGVATLLALVALFACFIPARRATKVDPLVALRCE